jgi:diadenosine tetraphosphate (Ap4A) HIT family hydrolase
MQAHLKRELKRLAHSTRDWKLLMRQEPKKPGHLVLGLKRHEKMLEPMRLGRSIPFHWMLLTKQEH